MGKKNILLVLLGVLLVGSLGVNVWFALNQKSETVSKVGSVCGDSIISKYNDIQAATSDEYSAKIKEVVDEIKAKNGYAEDSNCAMIELVSGLGDNKALYAKLEEFANNGENSSLKIRGLVGLPNISAEEVVNSGDEDGLETY